MPASVFILRKYFFWPEVRTTLLILYSLFLSCSRLPAQSNDAVYQLHLKNGLPSNHTYNSKIDSKGFLWIATENGMVKYNGYTCRVFTTKDGLPTDDVIGLKEDSKGRMWVFTLGNDAGFIVNDRYQSAFGNRKPERNLGISTMAEYRGDVFLLSGIYNDRQSYYRYGQDGKIAEYSTSIYSYFVINPEAGEYVITDGWNGYSYNIDFKAAGFGRGRYNCIYPGDRHNAGYAYERMAKFKARSGDYIHCKISKDGYYVLRHKKSLKLRPKDAWYNLYYNAYYFIERESWGIYIAGRDSLYRVDEDTVIVPVAANEYSNSTIHFIEKDSLRLYFTADKGLHLHYPQLLHAAGRDIPFPSVRYWENDYSSTALLQYNTAQQSGAYTPGIARRYDAGSRMLTGTTDVLRLSGTGQVHSLWNGKWLMLPWLKRNHGRDIYWKSIDEGAVFMLRFTGAVSIGPSRFFVSVPRGVFEANRHRDSIYLTNINSNRYSYLRHDSALNLLIAYTDNLLLLYRTTDGKNTQVNIPRLGGLLASGVERIQVLGGARYLIKTKQHLLIYHAFRQSYQVIPHFFNLEGSLAAATDDRLFIAGRFGVATVLIDSCMEEQRWKITPNFKGKNYMKVNDLVLTDTAVLLGTDEGVWTVGKKTLYHAPEFRGPYNFNLFVTGDSIDHVHKDDTVVFSQELNRLILDANNIYGTGALSFRYKWPGSKGRYVTTTGDVYTAELRPGRYYPFTIVAMDDAWRSHPVTVYLYRKPYWYQTQTWILAFWIGGVFLFLLFVGGVILLTRYFVERKNTKKQQLIELELRALYSQINPHFIFNSLNSAQYFINARDIDKAYDHVSKFARLLRAYLKSSHDRYVTIAEEVNMLHNYVELQQERFREPFSYSITVDNKIPKDNIQIPSLLLQPLVENAINHGLFHKKGEGHLNISFFQGRDHEEIICIIEDDGIGREQAKEISKANAASRYGSYGTKLTEQLIGIFERYEQMDISVSYTDKKLPQSGTIVTLTIRNVRYVA